ncbi:hypothetical protein DM872_28710 [Pseudomonas taiwanensis]|nr:hypothetical protein [Pseudomonas taiwanensis]
MNFRASPITPLITVRKILAPGLILALLGCGAGYIVAAADKPNPLGSMHRLLLSFAEKAEESATEVEKGTDLFFLL